MKQTNKISLDTIKKQQEKHIEKLYKERDMLEKALEDKEKQIEMQEYVLDKIIKG